MSKNKAPSGDTRQERGKALVDWSTAVFAIFAGVWWAYIADKVLTRSQPIPLGTWAAISIGVASFVMALYLLLFGYVYVRWMWWVAMNMNWGMSLSSFAKRQGVTLPLTIAGMLLITLYLSWFGVIPWAEFVYGATLLVGWPAVTTVVVLNAPK